MSGGQPRGRSAVVPSKQKLRLWLRLLRSTRAIEGELRERLRADFDTTLPRFDVLSALYRYAPSSKISRTKPGAPTGIAMTALSRHLLVSNGNVTVIVDRLVEDGLVLREPAANDRRSNLVRLSPKGEQQFRVMAAAHEAWLAEIIGELDLAELELVMEFLDKTIPHLNASRGDRA